MSASPRCCKSLAFREKRSSRGPGRTGATRYGWALGRHSMGVNRRRSDCRRRGVGDLSWGGCWAFEALAPPNALPALTKMPCHRHCERQWQGDGIHRHAAGNVLHSLCFLPADRPTSLLYLRSETQDLSNIRCHEGDLLAAAQSKDTCINRLRQFILLT
jgi:hypothetical protein